MALNLSSKNIEVNIDTARKKQFKKRKITMGCETFSGITLLPQTRHYHPPFHLFVRNKKIVGLRNDPTVIHIK